MATAMLTEPTTLSAANYVLASGSAFYRQRTGSVKAIVMHVTAGLQDLGMEGTDESAEGTNRWALSSGARVSWHRISDTDGVERCLPSWATAWHAKGFNSNTVGLEISNRDAKWLNKPVNWVKWTIWHAARAVADWVKKYKVPLRRATRAELERAIATNGAPVGFVDHSRLSDMRVDPGAEFPWELFFKYVRQVIAGYLRPDVAPPTGTAPVPIPYPGHQHHVDSRDDSHVGLIQQKLKLLGFYKMTVDSKFGPGTRSAVIAFQRSRKLSPDGYVGPKTWAALKLVK